MFYKELKVCLFISRNKDNRDVVDFKKRKKSFVTTKSIDDLKNEFDSFVNAGRFGEVSRFYISVNSRDNKKIQKSLQHYLLDNVLDLSKIDSKIASIASKPENALEHKWLFDCDFDNVHNMNDFERDVRESLTCENDEIVRYKTMSGYALVVPHGFDARVVLSCWPNVELKRDGMLLCDYNAKIF
ncbi:hypothetical protein [Streptococcus ruminantium]|uniref:hypothetical protein n=1 Tax=Streptococcus ruminantium TaxID=1917441 RepID=UPI0012DE0A6A|nr:hypothetical protein [Streptococcus ruminantium]MDQ8820611.1 hypothetical protein [Streptococcus ruminantium]